MQSIKFKLVINLKIAKGTRGWKMTSTHSPAPTGEIE
jgi:hypothetical protein